MKIRYKANFWSRGRIWEVKKRKIVRISLGINFWGLSCTIVDLKCLKFDNNKEEEEEEKEDNNDREEDNNNKEDNDIKEEEEALRAKRRPEGPKGGPKGQRRPEEPYTRSWGPEGPLTSSTAIFLKSPRSNSIAQYYISLYLGWEIQMINISSGWAIN